MILEGMAADLVVFDDKAISDEATFSQPHQFASGIKLVIVNGEIAARDGKPSEKRYGRSLRHFSSN
jgi:N-acyl-D-aspartate/D-glutamate deacylase